MRGKFEIGQIEETGVGNPLVNKVQQVDEDGNFPAVVEEVKAPAKQIKKAVPPVISVVDEKINLEKLDRIVRLPKVEVYDKKLDFSRANYSIRKDVHAYITELSRRARISINLLVEYLLEEYLHDGGIESVKDDILNLSRMVKFKENGVAEYERTILQMTLPTYYTDLVGKTTEEINVEFGLKLDKGNLIDILLQAKLIE